MSSATIRDRRARVPLALLAPVSLLLLVVALGALQYHWVGQVSEAEREQLKQSLDRHAREFATEFDREIGRAYEGFAVPAGYTPSAPERFVKEYDEWLSSARFPATIKTAYVALQRCTDFELHRFDPASRSFAIAD